MYSFKCNSCNLQLICAIICIILHFFVCFFVKYTRYTPILEPVRDDVTFRRNFFYFFLILVCFVHCVLRSYFASDVRFCCTCTVIFGMFRRVTLSLES